LTSSNVLAARQLAAGIPALVLAAERLAFVAAPGLHGRRRSGAGDQFWQFRDWQPGEESRRIDWRRSARSDRLYARERESEASRIFELVLHRTPGLNFQSLPSIPTKFERLTILLLALAALLLRAGEHVALSGITPPLGGRQALNHLALALATGGTAPTNPRARRIEFGDFLTPAPRFSGVAGGAVLHSLDPAECDFPYRGNIIFEGFGTTPPESIQSAQNLSTAYRARIAAQRQAVADAARSTGQTAIFHRTDHPPAPALAALYSALRE
jgi:uncharacterized protein (DUF58 family)